MRIARNCKILPGLLYTLTDVPLFPRLCCAKERPFFHGRRTMHVPDGYLSPIFSLGAGLVTVPTWVVGARKINAVLSRRTVPLLATFSALAFTLMMFNIPVPGGTTAHAVGGTLIAIVLGP